MFNLFTPNVPTVSVDQLKKVMDSQESYSLIDVRTHGEYARGSLKGSINIPMQDIEGDILRKYPDKSERLYVYCLSGSRSAHAVQTIQSLGYTQVYHVSGGLLTWRAKRFPVESSS